jgi:hypothetical protein
MYCASRLQIPLRAAWVFRTMAAKCGSPMKKPSSMNRLPNRLL